MSSQERDQHPLLSVLRGRDPQLADQAKSLIQQSARFLEYTLSTFPTGTDHTHRHTRTVEKIARMVLSDDFLAALSGEEIFFLAVACHYHDLAMAGTEADDRSPETREQVRRDHAIRIGDIVRDKWAELGFENQRLAYILGEVCRGHRPNKTSEGVADWQELNPTEVLGPGIAVRVRLLAALTYAIDELHLGADRAPERVQNWRNIQDEESRRHWRRHQAINGPVLEQSGSLLYQVQADTPEFEENLRSQVFRKAFSAMSDLRRQAAADGVTCKLPSITIQWQRERIWKLLLVLSCADIQPRPREEIVRAILDRFRSQTVHRVRLDDVCTEVGNAEAEQTAAASRTVRDAVTKGELIAMPQMGTAFVLSAEEPKPDSFFQLARDADSLDLQFVGRYRRSWEQELFANEFGRQYVRNSVFPVVQRTYSVDLANRPATDLIRALLESSPTAARLIRDYAPPTSNLVKEALLAHAALVGALIDCHADPERLLDEKVRTATRALAASDESLVRMVRLLEELALIGGFATEDIAAGAFPSKAAIDALERPAATDQPTFHVRLTQKLPDGAGETTHLHRLLWASRRAETPIQLTTAAEYKLNVHVEGNDELASKPTAGVVFGVDPTGTKRHAFLAKPARVEVSRTTRTVRLYLGQFSDDAPTTYPVVVNLPSPHATVPGQRATINTSVQWPELTVRDTRVLASANQMLRSSGARVELILEADERVLGSMENPQGSHLFDLGSYEQYVHRGLRGLDAGLPAPILLRSGTWGAIAELEADQRESRWREEREKDPAQVSRVSSIFLRLTTAAGIPTEEQFLRFLPFDFLPVPTFEGTTAISADEITRQWKHAETDFLVTGFFSPDIYELSQELREWCEDPRKEFPFHFTGSGTPDPVTRSVMTLRLLRSRERVWHRDRPVIFEFRPVNRREAYEMESKYWQSVGDERRAKLAKEISDREGL